MKTTMSLSWMLTIFSSTILFAFLGGGQANVFVQATAPDIIAIAPDRSTAYPNGLHNGLWLSAKRLGVSLTIWDVGNFDGAKSAEVLERAILMPADEQPKVYCIWPVDFPSREIMKRLYDTHGVPIIQMNQLPSDGSSWEWDHLLGYAGPDDTLRAKNAGLMLIDALPEGGNVVGLGYPESYGGYGLSMNAFAGSVEGSSVELVRRLPLDWGTQPAYEATLGLMDEFGTVSGVNAANGEKEILHGIYAMDDNILLGIYQALVDLGIKPGEDIILVGTVCNGARELLENNIQYGTTVQAPSLEGQLAIGMAYEYIQQGNLTGSDVEGDNTIRFTPNPSSTSATWEDMFVEFLGDSSTVDGLCTWSLDYERVAGPTSVELTGDICDIVSCEYVPKALYVVGYVLTATNYGLAALAAIMLYIFREAKIIGIAQPTFLAIVILGSIVDTTSIIFMSRDNRDFSDEELDRACLMWPILLSIGHMMTTATLAAKIYRVKRLVDAGLNVRRVQITVAQVSLFIVLFVGLDAIVLAAWFATDPYRWTVKSSSEDFKGYITEAVGQCESEGDNYYVFPLLIAILHVGVLLYANWLAYATSKYHNISDSKAVAICLFNSIQLLLIGAPILALVGGNVATSYLIRVCFVFLNNFGVLVIIVLPKLFKCLTGKGDELPNFNLTEVSRKSRGDGGGGGGSGSGGSGGQPNSQSGVQPSSQSTLDARRPPKAGLKTFDEEEEDNYEEHEDEPEQAPVGDRRVVSFAAESETNDAVGAALQSQIAKEKKKKEQAAAKKAATRENKDILGGTGWSEVEPGVLSHKGSEAEKKGFLNRMGNFLSNASASRASHAEEPEPEDFKSVSSGVGSTSNSKASKAGSTDSGGRTKDVTPQSVLDVMWRGRGYSRELYPVKDTAYYNEPTPLQLSSFNENVFELVQQGKKDELKALLRTPGMSQNPSNEKGVTLIHEICRQGNVGLLNMVLDEAKSKQEELRLVQIADSEGRTPMHYVCMPQSGILEDSEVPVAEITAGSAAAMQESLQARFAIVEALTALDRRLFSMTDMYGHAPLDCAPKDQWKSWQDFLYVVRDKYWPRRLVRVDGDEPAPELSLEKPNSRPLPDPAST